jgi:hypothetical protein
MKVPKRKIAQFIAELLLLIDQKPIRQIPIAITTEKISDTLSLG